MNSWTFNYKPEHKNWNKWKYAATEGVAEVAKTEEETIEEVLRHPNLGDRGFFEEMVSWLRRDAPKKLRVVISNLYPWSTGLSKANADLSYERLCESVYSMGFRASEMIEKRMILGPSNEWVRKYFADFGPRK